MDYHAHYQFASGQPFQNFMAIPPLTPSNSHSASSDEFNNTSPPKGFEGIPPTTELFHTGFDYNPPLPDGGPQRPAHTFASPAVPPPNTTQFAHASQQQQQQQAHHSHAAPPIEHHQSDGSINNNMLSSKMDGALEDPSQMRAGSDEDENLTPAQSRRKAQNRAAQRAFRERKEKHVKDLETKIASLEAAQQQASVENERLKRDLQKVSTENEILRATSAVNNGNHQNSRSPEPATTGPMNYRPTDFYSNVLKNHNNKALSHRIVTSDDGERLLAVAATWDYIINHDLYKRGMVDVSNVSERLKTQARCDGQGPVFSESAILNAMEQSVASGSDDLL